MARVGVEARPCWSQSRRFWLLKHAADKIRSWSLLKRRSYVLSHAADCCVYSLHCSYVGYLTYLKKLIGLHLWIEKEHFVLLIYKSRFAALCMTSKSNCANWTTLSCVGSMVQWLKAPGLWSSWSRFKTYSRHSVVSKIRCSLPKKKKKVEGLYSESGFILSTKCLIIAGWTSLDSGGHSNLEARGKNFQKLMLSEKKKRSDLGLHIFLPKSRCSLKKKKKRSSLRFYLWFPYFSPKIKVFSKKKKRSSLRIVLWTNICSESKTICAVFEGGPEATASFASPNIHYCRWTNVFQKVSQHTGWETLV